MFGMLGMSHCKMLGGNSGWAIIRNFAVIGYVGPNLKGVVFWLLNIV